MKYEIFSLDLEKIEFQDTKLPKFADLLCLIQKPMWILFYEKKSLKRA